MNGWFLGDQLVGKYVICTVGNIPYIHAMGDDSKSLSDEDLKKFVASRNLTEKYCWWWKNNIGDPQIAGNGSSFSIVQRIFCDVVYWDVCYWHHRVWTESQTDKQEQKALKSNQHLRKGSNKGKTRRQQPNKLKSVLKSNQPKTHQILCILPIIISMF